MIKTKEIAILGRPIQLQERSKAQMEGATIGDLLTYKFYDGEFHGMPLLFAEPKGKVATPRCLSVTANNLTSLLQLPIVFLLPACPAYERQRLIDKDVYFVVSEKYVHLPMLLANERVRKTKQAKTLTPVAQYLLLYHLQIGSIEGMAARDIEDKIPYSYASITLGLTCLEDLGLCKKVAEASKRKVIHFDMKGMNLWEQAQPFLVNPVEERIYCDGLLSDDSFPECGINALAHYTRLNPDPERTIMMSVKQLRNFKSSEALVRPNEFDGNIIIEAWKYPPVTATGVKAEWVDKLSLAISLREDEDPRVEGEVERLINETEWKD
ncbi:MAG: hypothetical protein UDM12_09305 [Prevotellamassilia sp.]|nr:hypothetical protein [Prevotellamassilia sp.]